MQSLKYLVCASRQMGRQSFLKMTTAINRSMCTNDPNEKSIAKPQISFVNNAPAVKQNYELQIDWDKEMQLIEDEENSARSLLAPVDDESKIYAEPMLQPTFNLAAYAQKSETLQKLLQLGVRLDRLDNSNHGAFIANLDFKRDIEPYILLFTNDIGIPIDDIATLFTKNPNILRTSLDDIQVRINYLELKRFKQDDIVRIITKNPMWLNYTTREIDDRLGFFQKDFQLNGNEVRQLTVTGPKLITYDMEEIKSMSFSIREECVFEPQEVREILLKCPNLWMLHRIVFMERYDFVSFHMKIENSQLAMMPRILSNRLFRIKERHGFLKHLKRAQYNPKLPLYISLDDLCFGIDEEFAVNVAKTTYEQYDRYLRTL